MTSFPYSTSIVRDSSTSLCFAQNNTNIIISSHISCNPEQLSLSSQALLVISSHISCHPECNRGISNYHSPSFPNNNDFFCFTQQHCPRCFFIPHFRSEWQENKPCSLTNNNSQSFTGKSVFQSKIRPNLMKNERISVKYDHFCKNTTKISEKWTQFPHFRPLLRKYDQIYWKMNANLLNTTTFTIKVIAFFNKKQKTHWLLSKKWL